jgi:hypothetical protein
MGGGKALRGSVGVGQGEAGCGRRFISLFANYVIVTIILKIYNLFTFVLKNYIIYTTCHYFFPICS